MEMGVGDGQVDSRAGVADGRQEGTAMDPRPDLFIKRKDRELKVRKAAMGIERMPSR